MSSVRCSNSLLQHVPDADLAHLVERHLAKVEVASSSLVIRSIALYYLFHYKAHKERSCVLYFFTLSPSLHLWHVSLRINASSRNRKIPHQVY